MFNDVPPVQPLFYVYFEQSTNCWADKGIMLLKIFAISDSTAAAVAKAYPDAQVALS